METRALLGRGRVPRKGAGGGGAFLARGAIDLARGAPSTGARSDVARLDAPGARAVAAEGDLFVLLLLGDDDGPSARGGEDGLDDVVAEPVIDLVLGGVGAGEANIAGGGAEAGDAEELRVAVGFRELEARLGGTRGCSRSLHLFECLAIELRHRRTVSILRENSTSDDHRRDPDSHRACETRVAPRLERSGEPLESVRPFCTTCAALRRARQSARARMAYKTQ